MIRPLTPSIPSGDYLAAKIVRGEDQSKLNRVGDDGKSCGVAANAAPFA
jgi:hypothetical protein